MIQLRRAVPLAVLLLTVAGLVLISRQSEPAVLLYASLLSAGAAVTTALLWRADAVTARMVFVGTLLAHGITLAGVPAFEDDFFRFIWDGWRTWQTGSPYGVAPEDYFASDAVPLALTTVLDGINYPEYPTIYGPVLQLAFASVFAIFGTNPIGLQLLFAAVNLLLVALLLGRHAPGTVALYAWNPLVIAETSLHLHPDGLMAVALFASVIAGRTRPLVAGLMLGVAAGVKLVALAAWPLLLRMQPTALMAALGCVALSYLVFLVQGQGAGFESTATFAARWHFNPFVYEPLYQLLGWPVARVAALVIAGVLVLWVHARSRSIDDVPIATIFGIILLMAPAVNSWYLLWLLPFAVGRAKIWPFAAAVALPWSYLTGLNLNDQSLDAFAVHPLARSAQAAILSLAVLYDWRAYRRARSAARSAPAPQLGKPAIAVIMPALDEEASIGTVISEVRAAIPDGLKQIIVIDNGCTDRTASVAQAAGAQVVVEPARGYGAACLAGLAAIDSAIEIVLFLDSDGSDVVADAPAIIAPIIAGHADLVIGSRALGKRERGSMTAPQRFGNWLAPLLVRLIWDVRYTDLGPFRAIRRSSLEALAMQDRDFGWTIEMQVRAAKLRLRTVEVPTGYRRRIGVSKISGTVNGVVKAGCKILYVIGREAFGDFGARQRGSKVSRTKLH